MKVNLTIQIEDVDRPQLDSILSQLQGHTAAVKAAPPKPGAAPAAPQPEAPQAAEKAASAKPAPIPAPAPKEAKPETPAPGKDLDSLQEEVKNKIIDLTVAAQKKYKDNAAEESRVREAIKATVTKYAPKVSSLTPAQCADALRNLIAIEEAENA